MGAHLKLVFSFFIITTFYICAASPPPTSPPPKCAPPPTPPPPPPTFRHQESRRYELCIFILALGVNTIAVVFLHQTQEVIPPANPQPPIQLADPNQRAKEKEKLKLTVLKWFNLVATLFFFFVTMHLQYKYKTPTKGEVAETLTYTIFAFVILSGILKTYWDFGHMDFIVGMLSNFLINAINKTYRMQYVFALSFILLFFALDGYFNFLGRLYNRCKAFIETIHNHH